MYFYKGKKDITLDKEEESEKLILIKKEIAQTLDIKNLSFLFGAGISSFWKKVKEELSEEEVNVNIGIPAMKPMAEEFYPLLTEEETFLSEIKVDTSRDIFKDNLEKFLEVLFSLRFVFEKQENTVSLQKIEALITKTKEFILEKCINEDNIKNHPELIELYKKFYRKLVYRDNNLSKTNIFTTNYDLYNERALDQLGIIYSNGFAGNIERYFNPTVFNYAFAEQMELSNNKWNVIDNFIYLYKLHGSVNWIEDDNPSHMFKIREIQNPKKEDSAVMIYPTPVKQNASFGSPYSDLFREFQKKLMQQNNILITLGYSFSDEHINNLIYQALTIPTFRLIVFGDSTKGNIEKLLELDDPRIWIIGGKDDSGETIHYFEYFISKILPDISEEKIEDSIEKVITTFINKSGTQQ